MTVPQRPSLALLCREHQESRHNRRQNERQTRPEDQDRNPSVKLPREKINLEFDGLANWIRGLLLTAPCDENC